MKVQRNVYRYDDHDVNESVSIDVSEDGDAYVTVNAATKRIPRNQLTQMLYRLRDERRRTVTAEIAINNDPKKEGKK